MDKKLKVINPKLMLMIGVLGISFSSIFIKYSSAPSMVIAAYRLGWTVLLMLPVVLIKFRGEMGEISRSDVLWSMLSGFFLAVHFSVWFESLKYTSVASSTVLVSTEVVFSAVGFVLIFKGRINKMCAAAILITLIGSVIIAAGDFGSGKNELYGDALALLGAVMVAVYTLIGRRQRTHLSTTVYTFITYSACFTVLLIFNIVSNTPLFGYGIKEVVLGLLLGISCTLLGHSVFSWCLKYLSPSYVSSAKLLEPVFASILAVFIYREIPSLLQIAGGIIVIGGVYLYSANE